MSRNALRTLVAGVVLAAIVPPTPFFAFSGRGPDDDTGRAEVGSSDEISRVWHGTRRSPARWSPPRQAGHRKASQPMATGSSMCWTETALAGSAGIR